MHLQAQPQFICYNTDMTHDKDLRVIAFVGLEGAGVSTAVSFFTQKGYPKVQYCVSGKRLETSTIVDQIAHLKNAGQRVVVIDGLTSWSEYQELKHAFPGELELVSIVAPRHARYHRLERRPYRPMSPTEAHEHDEQTIADGKAGPIAIANHYVINNGSIKAYAEQLENLERELEIST